MKLGLFSMSKLGAKGFAFVLKEVVSLMKCKVCFWSSSFEGEAQRPKPSVGILFTEMSVS